MRDAFIRGLTELADDDPRVVLLTGDLGFTVVEPFAERFPGRFWNVGVSEQNMVGVATGLADAGFQPFVYSIATFATLRPYEFVRNGPVLHELPVRLVGIGGGFDYGANGVSHYALEDIGLMRLLPGMTVIAPAHAAQAHEALLATRALPGPAYLRIAKATTDVPGLDGRFELGRLALIGDGRDVALIALGTMAAEAVQAAEILAAEGVEATVAVISTVAPAPVDDLVDLLGQTDLALTAEAHYATGGIGSLVAELAAERDLGCRVLRHGVRTMPRGDTGPREYLLAKHGLAPEALAASALAELARTGH